MNIIDWLIEGDVSIQYQTKRDLLGINDLNLKNRIATEGFGKKLLDNQQEDYHWGGGYYRYKWISSHYTLLELRRLNCNPDPKILKTVYLILDTCKTLDGGITANSHLWDFSDVCLNGMGLFYLCYFNADAEKLHSIIDFIITQQLTDGGFNCNYNYKKYGATHSSVHSTVSLIEGINEYLSNGYKYKSSKLRTIRNEAIEFLLVHKLYKSDKTGKIIHPDF